MADAAFILGFAAWRLRRRIQRKPDTDPPHMLFDSIRHSVFCTGFTLKNVENPALREALLRDGGPGGMGAAVSKAASPGG